MLILLSPAKTLDETSKLPTRKHSQPRLLEETERLVEVMRGKSPEELSTLMGISDDLAVLNTQRFAEFELPLDRKNARPAALTFAGDLYQGLAAGERFDERDFTEAQKTIRILSGLYGVLRPLDLIAPYRLEMGTPLKTDRGSSLYDWWGDQVTELVRKDLADSPGADAVINLASEEYVKVINPDLLDAPMIAPRFEDTTPGGKRQFMSFFAKRARGEMAAWLVQNRIRRVSALKDFDGAGYRYDKDASTAERPVFVRAYADR